MELSLERPPPPPQPPLLMQQGPEQQLGLGLVSVPAPTGLSSSCLSQTSCGAPRRGQQIPPPRGTESRRCSARLLAPSPRCTRRAPSGAPRS